MQGFVKAQGAVRAGESPYPAGEMGNTSWRELDVKESQVAGRAVQTEGREPARTLRQKAFQELQGVHALDLKC